MITVVLPRASKPIFDQFAKRFGNAEDAQNAYAHLALARSLMLPQPPEIGIGARFPRERFVIAFACYDDRIRALVGVQAGVDCFGDTGMFERLLNAHVERGAALLAEGGKNPLSEVVRRLPPDPSSSKWAYERFDDLVDQAVQEAGLEADLTEKRVGHSVRCYDFALRNLHEMAAWPAIIAQLEAALCEDGDRIRYSVGKGDSLRIEVPKPAHLRRPVRWDRKSAAELIEAEQGVCIVPGTDLAGRAHVVDLSGCRCVIVAGAAASGVTGVAAAVAASLALRSDLEVSLYGEPIALVKELPEETFGVIATFHELKTALDGLIDHRATGETKPAAVPVLVIELGLRECGNMAFLDRLRGAILDGLGLLVIAASGASATKLSILIDVVPSIRLVLRTGNPAESLALSGDHGCELLAGRGDMLAFAPGNAPVRLQGYQVLPYRGHKGAFRS